MQHTIKKEARIQFVDADPCLCLLLPGRVSPSRRFSVGSASYEIVFASLQFSKAPLPLSRSNRFPSSCRIVLIFALFSIGMGAHSCPSSQSVFWGVDAVSTREVTFCYTEGILSGLQCHRRINKRSHTFGKRKPNRHARCAHAPTTTAGTTKTSQ